MAVNASLPTLTEKSAGFFRTLPGIVVIVALYTLAHMTLRLLASGNLGEDDPLSTLMVQTLSAGYSLDYGPAYEWALWGLQQFIGTGMASFLLLKYALLIAMAGLLFLITRRLTGSTLWALIAVESMASVYQIFWRFHEGFTNRVGTMVLAVASFWALMRLIDRGGQRDYLLFAALVGLGLLNEHSYAVFLCALLAAATIQPAIRQRLLTKQMLIALPLTALIISPYANWLLAEPQRLSGFIAAALPKTSSHSAHAMFAGLRDALTFPLLVLSPYLLVVLATFPKMWRLFRQMPLRPARTAAPDLRMLLLHLFLIELACLILFDALLFPRFGYPVHSLLPLFVLGIVWLTDKASATAPSLKRIRVFMLILAAFTVAAFVVRSGNLIVYEPFCSRCRWGVPYPDLAEQLRLRGFRQGTIVTNELHIGGNLRRFFPDSRFILPGKAVYAAPMPAGAGGQTAILWLAEDNDKPIPPALQSYVPAAAAASQPEQIRLSWHHLWKPAGYRYSTWNVLLIEAPDASNKK
jgi:hypothetical protein